MKILLIEDDPTIAEFIIRGMRQAGFSVDHASDGNDGLHMALTSSYDVGIFDIMLPSLNGLELSHEFAKRNSSYLLLF